MAVNDKRLIEQGFPCHQVGAETQRERGASSALPPLYYLHVWWARRPLTPSRAAILGSLLPADTNPESFVRSLGIEKKQVTINGCPWTLTGKLLDRIELDPDGGEYLLVDGVVLSELTKENIRREGNRKIISDLCRSEFFQNDDFVLNRWKEESRIIREPFPPKNQSLAVERLMGDPAHIKERIAFAKSKEVQNVLGTSIKWAPEDLYGYTRAFMNNPALEEQNFTIMDPTSGGGSIPFEALRLGHTVIANELNPVATGILYATLDYPARFGISLLDDIEFWGKKLLQHVEEKMDGLSPFSPLPGFERESLHDHLKNCPEIIPLFDVPEYDQTGILYCRQVTCPHCGGEAPLFNTCWLSKETKDPWGIRI